MGGKAVPKGVTGGRFGDPGPADGAFDRFLQAGGIGVVAAGLAGTGIYGDAGGGKEVLPAPLAVGVRVFAGQGVGQVDPAVSGGQIGLMQAFYLLKVALQRGNQAIRQHGEAVFIALAAADGELALLKIKVFDAQPETLGEAQAAAVEQLGHQLVGLGQLGDDPAGFSDGEDDGQMFGFLGAKGVDGASEFLAQDFPVEKEQGGEGLVLGGGGHVLLNGQVGEEGFNLRDAHLFGVAFVVEKDEAFDPIDIGFFGAEGVVFEAEGVAHLIQQFGGLVRHGQLL